MVVRDVPEQRVFLNSIRIQYYKVSWLGDFAMIVLLCACMLACHSAKRWREAKKKGEKTIKEQIH
jgi:hypothetical protein